MTCSLCKNSGHNSITCPKKKISVPLADPATASLESLLDIPPTDTPDVAMVRGLATEILSTLGAGHTESVYHNSMKIGLQDANLKFETERDIIIKFRGRYVGTVRADLIVENRLVIELKSSSATDSVVSDAIEQCRIYMRETATPSGVVVVFPKRSCGKLIISVV